MKKVFIILILFAFVGVITAADLKNVKCSSTLVTLEFDNVKLKKVQFINESNIAYKVISDSAEVIVKVKGSNVLFSSKKKGTKAIILLYLPKSKTYQTYLQHQQLCKFDYQSIKVEIGDGQKVIIKNGEIKVLDVNNDQIVCIGSNGIYVNDEDQLVKINGNGIFIKTDEEMKNYNGFWAKLLGKTITGFTGLVMDLSLKNIGKNIAKIINEQNLRIVADKMESIGINVNIAKFREKLQKQFNIRRNTDLFIDNVDGDITIKKSYTDTLKIIAIKYANKEKNIKKIMINIEKQKNKIKIKTYKTDQLINGGVKLTLYCPEKIKLQDIKTSNGDITIKNSNGKLNALSSNGKITISKFKGDVKALTSNGNIFAEKIKGECNLVTSNGCIDAKNVSKLLTAKTSNGKINLKKVALISDVSSSNSDIFISTNNFLDRTEIRTSNGKITIEIPQNINLSITAETSNGEVLIYDLNFKKKSRKDGKFKAILGDGSRELMIKTSNSDIIIKRKK